VVLRLSWQPVSAVFYDLGIPTEMYTPSVGKTSWRLAQAMV
jgi:hypothetical protein